MTVVDICNLSLSRIGSARVENIAEKEDVNLPVLYEQVRDELLVLHPWKFALKRTRLKAAGLLNCSDRTITFNNANPDTITDSGNGFVTAGFESGDIVVVQDSKSNNNSYDIKSVAAGALTLEEHEEVVAETLVNNAKLKLYARPAYIYNFKYAMPSDCLSVVAVNETTIYKQSTWDSEGKFIVTNEIDGNGQIFVQYIKQIRDAALFSSLFISCLVLKLAAELAIAIARDKSLHDDLLNEFNIMMLESFSTNIHRGNPDESFADTSWQQAGR
ncbi:MAG: hypothetical protein Q8J68_14785 [Methanolobus sp.]|uniref:hypothetical protein n=1 Tax=Methanolobus sp. TaxID=1874737 RepID=UPI0027318961|nr:hypothetical protein [Methanolobus sp.]MDP2218541.1 hypothetical protein [Methanolobus sp.]